MLETSNFSSCAVHVSHLPYHNLYPLQASVCYQLTLVSVRLIYHLISSMPRADAVSSLGMVVVMVTRTASRMVQSVWTDAVLVGITWMSVW